MVLIDDRSALNVCPLKTASCLGLSIEDFVPTNQHVKAYDNNKREVLGTVTLELTIGPMVKKERLTLDGFGIEKPGFERREEEVERIPMEFDPYSNNNVVAMIRKMNYLPRMNLRKTVKEATAQVPTIPTTTPPFGLGYKPTDDDLLEMEVRRMVHAKAKEKGLLCPLKPLKPYTPTLNEKFVKAGDSQCYWGFPKLRYDPEFKTMVLGFELFFDCDNKLLELKKEDTNWVPTDQANYMDPDAMTTPLGDAICNIKEEEYQEACQHALKTSYKVRTNDENEEEEEAPSDYDESSDNKSDNSGDSSSSDSGDSGNNNSNDSDNEKSNNKDYDHQYSGNDRREPFSDREDEDVGSFYEDQFDDDVDYYDGDLEDDAEAEGGDIENDVVAEDEDVEDDVKAEDEDVEKDAKVEGIQIMMNTPMGGPQIGVALLMSV